jgi:hypothetical protein
MSKLLPRASAAVASVVLSIAFVAALVFPAAGFAADDPLLSFSPAPVGFAKTTVGAESQPQVVDVYNVSGAAVAIDSVGFSGADAADFKFAGGGGGCGWLEADQHCTTWVSFAPGSAGPKAATLSVKLQEAPEQMVELSGEAVPAQLAFTPGSHDFGIQRVNRGEGSTNFQLTNAGEAPAQLGGLGIGGPDTNNFWTNGGDCGPGSWLAPGESCGVQVGFNPWDTVAYEAELQAHAYGATFSAALSGFGGRTLLLPDSDTIEFGAVPVGSVGEVTPIVLTNHGNLPASVFIAVIAGGSVASFQLIDEDCTWGPIAPGESCTAEVRSTPQVVGPKTARLALFGDDDGGAMALLSGEGLEPSTPDIPGAAPAGLTTSAGTSPVSRRGKYRRFGRGKTLAAAQARCHALRCREALRARTAVAGD